MSNKGAHQQQSKRRRFPEKEPKIWWIPTAGNENPTKSPPKVLKSSTVSFYLQSHPEILDEIILSLSRNKIHDLIRIQEVRSNTGKSEHSEQNKNSSFKKVHQRPLIQYIKTIIDEIKSHDLNSVMYNTATVLASALEVDWYSLYRPSREKNDLSEYIDGSGMEHCGPIGEGMTVSATAALIRETLMVENLPEDSRYPQGVGHPDRDVHNVLSVPLVFPSGDLLGVIELCKGKLKKPFVKQDLLFANWILGWMVSSMLQAHVDRVLHLQSTLSDFLWDVSKEGLFNLSCVDNLVEKILMFSKELVHADRFAMFLVNEEKNQLYADYFSHGSSTEGKDTWSSKKYLRFSCNQGIVGYVYTTGETVNIVNAYEDCRFDPEVDELTGYYTKSIMCMPITNRREVVGVIQMVNSVGRDHFTHRDEVAFKTYSSYCAVALHMSRIRKRLNLSEVRLKIAMEVIENYIVASEEESRTLSPVTPPESIPISFYHFDFHAYDFASQLPQLYIYMLHDLFGESAFEFCRLGRFVMTVKKNYRDLAYHNWGHGFQVAHSLYCMMKKNMTFWSTHEAMALIVAGLCHDVDHRGYDNRFYVEFNLPLAELYSTSVMEHHHYKYTTTILQLKDHDIFNFLDPNEYQQMLLMIQDAIIATDFSFYAKNQQEISTMIESGTFKMENEECRRVFKALMMTAADVCGSAKPWPTQMKMISGLYREFYLQGDIEKQHGLCPNELMNRDMKFNVPKQQINFIVAVSIPIFSTLSDVLPGCKPLLHGARSNLKRWQNIMDQRIKNKDTKTGDSLDRIMK